MSYRRLARSDRALPIPVAGDRCDAGRHAVRRRDPVAAGADSVRTHELHRLPQSRGGEPDRVVQGPRHDGGDLEGEGGRREGGHLRLDRQHLGERRGLRRPGRHDLRGAGAARQDRARQDGPGAGARRPPAAGRRQLRRLSRTGAEARDRLPGRAGQLGQPGPDRRARRPPRSRSATCSAARPTCT